MLYSSIYYFLFYFIIVLKTINYKKICIIYYVFLYYTGCTYCREITKLLLLTIQNNICTTSCNVKFTYFNHSNYKSSSIFKKKMVYELNSQFII